MKHLITLQGAKIALLIASTSLLTTSCFKDFIGKGNSKDREELQVETLTRDLEGEDIDALTIDQQGNIYASQFGEFSGNSGSGTIVYITDRDGNTSEFLTGLSGPLGNAIDDEGNFYVVNNNDGSSGEVLKVSPDGTRTQLAVIDGFPSGLTLDKNNNLYVSNFGAPTIHRISPTGEISIYATDDRLAGVVGIDFDSNGNLIAGNFSNADVLKINLAGEVELLANIPDTSIGYLIVANDIIFATGISVNKIFRITMDGVLSDFAGTGEGTEEDGNLLEASFNNPNGITFDKYSQTLFISEFDSPNIRKIELY